MISGIMKIKNMLMIVIAVFLAIAFTQTVNERFTAMSHELQETQRRLEIIEKNIAYIDLIELGIADDYPELIEERPHVSK